VVSQADITRFRGPPIRKLAHKWLHDLREKLAQEETEVIDLTDNKEYDWKKYVCSHHMAHMLVGTGIARFSGRFLNSIEPNWQKLALPGKFGKNRWDFIIERIDGSAVRLHPSANREAFPVEGSLAEWVYGTRASTPGKRTPDMYHHMSQAQAISAAQALALLRTREHELKEAGLPLDQVQDNLLARDCTFPLVEFLSGRPFGRAWLAKGIIEAVLCFKKEHHDGEFEPVIVCTTKEHTWHQLRFKGDQAFEVQ